jgi:hypothetical protein
MNNTPTLLSLDDCELQMLLNASALIPFEWRDRYIQLVADQLMCLDARTHTSMQQALASVASKMPTVNNTHEQELRRA